MIRVLFYTTAVEHTTFRKTARMLKKEGAEVKMYGYTRNNFPSPNDGLEVEVIGQVEHGNYLKRIITLFTLLSKLRKEIREYDVVHCFTLDTLIISYFSGLFMKKKLVYQVQDIRSVFFAGGIKEKVLKFLERVMLNKVDLLIVSSKYYYEDYFKPIYNFPENKVIVLENKLERSIENVTKERSRIDNKIVIGYFGVLRCPQSWEVLKKIVSESNNIIIYVRGKVSGIPSFEEDLKKYSNIIYEGVYESPKDLNEIYQKVDIVWAAYPYGNGKKNGNWTMARTIRFYESGAFKKPVIVQEGTADSKIVLKENIGLVIDMSNVEKSSKMIIENLNTKNLNSWGLNVIDCPQDYFIHNDEYKKVISFLKDK